MLAQDQEALKILNNFLKLNRARFMGYQNAFKQTDIEVLRVLFDRLMHTSSQCCEELCVEIFKIGGRPLQERYREQFDLVWKEINQALLLNDHPAILNACYKEELMAYKVYEYAFRYSPDVLSSSQKNICNQHLYKLRHDHNKVRNLRKVLLESQ